MSDTILVVDDEHAIRHAIKRAFGSSGENGCTVLEAESGAEAITQTQDGFPDVVLLDQCLPDVEGLDLVKQLKSIDPELPIILMTGHGSVDLAVEALKEGVDDFIEKPFRLEHLRANVDLLLDRQRLGRQVARLSGNRKARTSMIAKSAGMKKVLGLIKRVAAVPSTTVLIQGESGVGKELVAKSIHERSSRSDNNFIAINCAALSDNLLEAELFGYEKGAFTGADSKGKEGLFEAANGGTIFLDEVGEMPLALQTKLLRVLQERCIRRVGGLLDKQVDVRVVAATNRDLRAEVAAGCFRQDLYFRLRVVPIAVPPLRDRPNDILPLAKHLLKNLSPEMGRPELQFSETAVKAMFAYEWPGNVRELANAVERSVISAVSDEIQVEDLVLDEVLFEKVVAAAPVPVDFAGMQAPAPVVPDPAPSIPLGALVFPTGQRNLAEIERITVSAALEESGGSKTKAAAMLGINRTTLYNKIREIDSLQAQQTQKAEQDKQEESTAE